MNKRKNIKFRAPTRQSLTNIALHYLGRYAASEASLRRVLENRLRRAAMRIPEFAEDEQARHELAKAIDDIVASHKKSGVINDSAFAEIKIHSLRRKGKSRRAIKQKLAIKGIHGAITDEAFEKFEEGAEPDDAEFAAAIAFAKRKKLGHFGKLPPDDSKKRKDFAAFAREGFSSAIARRALQAEPPEEWE